MTAPKKTEFYEELQQALSDLGVRFRSPLSFPQNGDLKLKTKSGKIAEALVQMDSRFLDASHAWSIQKNKAHDLSFFCYGPSQHLIHHFSARELSGEPIVYKKKIVLSQTALNLDQSDAENKALELVHREWQRLILSDGLSWNAYPLESVLSWKKTLLKPYFELVSYGQASAWHAFLSLCLGDRDFYLIQNIKRSGYRLSPFSMTGRLSSHGIPATKVGLLGDKISFVKDVDAHDVFLDVPLNNGFHIQGRVKDVVSSSGLAVVFYWTLVGRSLESSTTGDERVTLHQSISENPHFSVGDAIQSFGLD